MDSLDLGRKGGASGLAWHRRSSLLNGSAQDTATCPGGSCTLIGRTQKIIDDWTTEGDKIATGTIALTAGEKYDLRLDYMEDRDQAKVKLFWSSASQPETIVPQLQLYPDGNGPNDRVKVFILAGQSNMQGKGG